MKVYTLEEVKKAIDIAEYRGYEWEQIIAKLTPIELPSDEDIFSVFRGKKMYDNDWEFINGAIWMREQILNQNK